MQRRVFLVKTVLTLFVCCSVWLPASHECYENFKVPVGSTADSTGSPANASHSVRSHDLLTKIPLRARPSAPGSCVACLWSHHLFLGKVIIGLGIPQFLSCEPLLARTPDPVIAILFDSASNRAPPASDPSSLDWAL